MEARANACKGKERGKFGTDSCGDFKIHGVRTISFLRAGAVQGCRAGCAIGSKQRGVLVGAIDGCESGRVGC